MPSLENACAVDPLGEDPLEQNPWPVDTPGGRYYAEFDDQAPVTREGQLIFFAQFLHAGGRWSQWCWNGFTTQKLKPCRFIANLVALVYNWWHLYARLHDGAHHREAITSRPALLGGVARLARHSGQSTVKVSLQHENRTELMQSITHVSNTLHRFHAITEQWTVNQRWALLLTHIFRHWLGHLPAEAGHLLSG